MYETFGIASRTEPCFTKIPFLVAIVVPLIMAVGVAKAMAQGHDITKIEIKNCNENATGLEPSHEMIPLDVRINQVKKRRVARVNTQGTK